MFQTNAFTVLLLSIFRNGHLKVRLSYSHKADNYQTSSQISKKKYQPVSLKATQFVEFFLQFNSFVSFLTGSVKYFLLQCPLGSENLWILSEIGVLE